MRFLPLVSSLLLKYHCCNYSTNLLLEYPSKSQAKFLLSFIEDEENAKRLGLEGTQNDTGNAPSGPSHSFLRTVARTVPFKATSSPGSAKFQRCLFKTQRHTLLSGLCVLSWTVCLLWAFSSPNICKLQEATLNQFWRFKSTFKELLVFSRDKYLLYHISKSTI